MSISCIGLAPTDLSTLHSNTKVDRVPRDRRSCLTAIVDATRVEKYNYNNLYSKSIIEFKYINFNSFMIIIFEGQHVSPFFVQV